MQKSFIIVSTLHDGKGIATLFSTAHLTTTPEPEIYYPVVEYTNELKSHSRRQYFRGSNRKLPMNYPFIELSL